MKKVNLIGPLTLVSCEILSLNQFCLHLSLMSWICSEEYFKIHVLDWLIVFNGPHSQGG